MGFGFTWNHSGIQGDKFPGKSGMSGNWPFYRPHSRGDGSILQLQMILTISLMFMYIYAYYE